MFPWWASVRFGRKSALAESSARTDRRNIPPRVCGVRYGPVRGGTGLRSVKAGQRKSDSLYSPSSETDGTAETVLPDILNGRFVTR